MTLSTHSNHDKEKYENIKNNSISIYCPPIHTVLNSEKCTQHRIGCLFETIWTILQQHEKKLGISSFKLSVLSN